MPQQPTYPEIKVEAEESTKKASDSAGTLVSQRGLFSYFNPFQSWFGRLTFGAAIIFAGAIAAALHPQQSAQIFANLMGGPKR